MTPGYGFYSAKEIERQDHRYFDQKLGNFLFTDNSYPLTSSSLSKLKEIEKFFLL